MPSQRPPPRSSEKQEEKYIITLPDKTEYLVVSHESDTSFVYYFGGAEAVCAVCQVYKEGTVMSRFQDVRLAHISNIDYQELCCLNRLFQRGTDIRTLIQLVLSIINKRHPWVIGATLNDYSERSCSNNYIIDLAIMHYLQDGQTWYMSRFGAVMSEKDNMLLKTAEESIIQKNLPWELLNSYIIYRDLSINITEVQDLYISSSNILVFFRRLYTKIGISEFCSFLSLWIDRFMKERFIFNFRQPIFTIMFDNPKVTPMLSYTEKLIESNGVKQEGGYLRRATRKHRKIRRRGGLM
jgi:hypothetical protein